VTLNPLVENHQIVAALWDAVNTSSGSLENVAPLIKRVLETGAWRCRIVPQLGNEPVKFNDFLKFIETKPLRGCGWPHDKIPPLLKDDPEAVRLWRKATVGEKHVHHDDNNNVIIKAQQGNSLAYTLDRLQRERPDLFERVKAGEMSANAAAIAAGFRKKLTPLEQIQKLWLRLDQDGRRAHLEWTLKHCAICGRDGAENGTWCDDCCDEGARSGIA
jgi:hypothetical protein